MIASRHLTARLEDPPTPAEQLTDAERRLVFRALRGTALHLGFVELTAEGAIHRYASPACARLLGVSTAELRDRPLDRLGLPEELVELWQEACLDAWRGEAPSVFDFIDPSTKPPRRLAFTVTPLPEESADRDGTVDDAGRYLCSYQVEDLPIRPWAPHDDASAEHVQHVVETTPALLWTADPSGDRDHFNRSWLDFTGRSIDEELGQGWTTHVHDDDLDIYRETFLDALHAREPFRVEYRLRRHDGAWRDLLDQGTPRFRSDGTFLGYVGSSTDITERRAAERRLEATGRWYRELVEGIDHLVIRVDRKGNIAFVNPASRHLLGAEPEECIGFPLLDFVHPEDHRTVRDLIAEPPTLTGSPIELRLRDRMGIEHDLLVTVCRRSEAEGLDLVGQDVTQSKRDRLQRQRLNKRLRQAQKLESMGVLAGGIAHDFNNLLMVILGNASLALQGLGSMHGSRRDIEQIETAALRAAELTQQMLAYSGKGQFVIESTDLSSVIEDMSSLIDATVAPDVRLDVHLADDLPDIECDVSQMRQIVMSLVNNASEAIEGSGSVRLETALRVFDRADLDQAFVADDLPEGTYVVLDVIDDGVGMDAETRARIFDPFFTTKFTGRGLGLAAVLGIVRGHGGGLRVDSSPGVGTTMTVLLPQSTAGQPASAEPSDTDIDRAAERGDGTTILVVDDDETVRRLATRLLESIGYSTLAAASGAEAVRLYQQHDTAIAAVLLDMVMPGLDGEDTFRQLLALDPDVRVVLSSGYSEDTASDRFDRGLALSLAGFLQKPYRRIDLARKLDEVLAAL